MSVCQVCWCQSLRQGATATLELRHRTLPVFQIASSTHNRPAVHTVLPTTAKRSSHWNNAVTRTMAVLWILKLHATAVFRAGQSCETICHATLTQESSHLLRKKRFDGKEIAPASSGMGQIKLYQISMTISGLVAPQVARKNARHPKQISAPPRPPSSTLCQHWPCGASSAQCQLRHGRGQRGVEAERPEQRLPYKLSSKQLKAFSSKHHA